MNRTALRQALTSGSFLATVAASVAVLATTALAVADPLVLLAVSVPGYLVLLVFAGTVDYGRALARLERADHLARLAAIRATGQDRGDA